MMPYRTDQEESSESVGFAHPPSHCAEIGVARGMTVADFGSGSGAHAFALAAATGNAGRVYAVDIQRDLLARIKNEAVRRALRHIDVLWGDLEEPFGSKIADGVVDVVLISNTLFQMIDKRIALDEARRILKPAGIFALIERNGAAGLHSGNVLPKEDALALARRADFEPIREFAAGRAHYGILFRPVAITL